MPPPAKQPRERLACRLLVEGPTDYNFFGHLFVKRGLYESSTDESGKNKITPKHFETCVANNWIGVLDGLTQIKNSDVDILGIIVDADTDLQGRWLDIKKKLKDFELDYELPETPDRQGFVKDGKKRIGIWLMPNNKVNGILEDLVVWMIHDNEDNQRLWQHVEDSIDNLPGGPRFESKDLAKAKVATWLAWQKEPGHPIGLAVTMGYVDADSKTVDDFIDWLKRLFQLQ